MTGNRAALAEVKRELRAQSVAARDSLPAGLREELSSRICGHAWEWLKREDITSLMAYVSFRSELNTHSLITRALEEQHELLLPRVVPGSGIMAVQAIRSWDELAPGVWGIYEPVPPSVEPQVPAPVTLPAVVFVPGLAFDSRGGRLGYGRGYYDRLRASWNAISGESLPPVWIGLAYGMQLVEEVPMDVHDAFMDMLITENGLLYCRKENAAWS